MKTKLGISILLLAAALAPAQTNNLTALLQQGLFEEQANRNLDAAIADYQAIARQFDKDRQLAATAIFRLGECYRMQGKTNEAALEYKRIVSEFTDQAPLVTLSRQNLTGMGMQPAPAVTAALQTQKDLLAKQITLAEQDLADVQRLAQTYVVSQDKVRAAEREVLRLKQQLAAMDSGRAELLDLSIPAKSEEDQEIERIQTMIQNSPDLINALSNGNTPLGNAAAHSWLKVAAYLLDHGAEVNARGGTALFDATQAGNRTMVEFLLAHGANANGVSNNNDRLPLEIAVQHGFEAVTKVLLDHKAEVNARDSQGNTPLFTAARIGHTNFVQMLLAAGADANVENDEGRTPLSFAAEGGLPEMVKMLLAAKADPNGGKLDAPLLCAINNNEIGTAELLLQAGAKPNAIGDYDLRAQPGRRGRSAVSFGGGRRGPVSGSGGGRVGGSAGGFGGLSRSVTPLWLAISENQAAMVQLLLKFKADPNDSPSGGQSLLFTALSDTNILEALLDAGAKVDPIAASPNVRVVETPVNWTPVGAAARQNNAAAVEILLKHGANPNLRDSIGKFTPLHWAANGIADRKVFELLLAQKADRNARATSGQTPLDILSEQAAPGNLATDAPQKAKAGELADWLRQQAEKP